MHFENKQVTAFNRPLTSYVRSYSCLSSVKALIGHVYHQCTSYIVSKWLLTSYECYEVYSLYIDDRSRSIIMQAWSHLVLSL